jgi:hypothetical protein
MPRRRGGKRHTMLMMFVGGVVSVIDGIPVQFLQSKTYGAGDFCSRPNPYSCIPVNCYKICISPGQTTAFATLCR